MNTTPATAPKLQRLDGTAVRVLLEQAFTLSFELPKYNQQLMTDYVALATATPRP